MFAQFLSHVSLFVTPWTVACQAALSMKFSRQEYWNRLSCPPLGHLPKPGIKPTSLASSALAVRFFITHATWEKWKSVTQLCLTLYSPWNSPAKNTGVGNLSLLQGIFPTQGSNPNLLHCRRNLYQLSQKGCKTMKFIISHSIFTGKESTCNVGDSGLICRLGRLPGEGNGNPFQYSWRFPWAEEPGGLQSLGLQRVGHDWGTNISFHLIIFIVNPMKF